MHARISRRGRTRPCCGIMPAGSADSGRAGGRQEAAVIRQSGSEAGDIRLVFRIDTVVASPPHPDRHRRNVGNLRNCRRSGSRPPWKRAQELPQRTFVALSVRSCGRVVEYSRSPVRFTAEYTIPTKRARSSRGPCTIHARDCRASHRLPPIHGSCHGEGPVPRERDGPPDRERRPNAPCALSPWGGTCAPIRGQDGDPVGSLRLRAPVQGPIRILAAQENPILTRRS